MSVDAQQLDLPGQKVIGAGDGIVIENQAILDPDLGVIGLSRWYSSAAAVNLQQLRATDGDRCGNVGALMTSDVRALTVELG